MTSLLTNVAAMVALQTLNQITRDLIETNDRVSTGLRIREASDSAAYWAIATTTRSDNGALGAVREAIALGRSVFDVAYSGLEHTRESLDKVKQLLVSATQPGINRANVQEEVAGLLTDMVNKAGAAVINEQNFLSIADSATENMTKSIVASFERQGGTVQISTIDVDVSTIYLVDGNATPTGILDVDRTAGIGFGKILRIGDTDVYGEQVNVASKLGEDSARSNEILVSAEAKEAIGSFPDVTYEKIEAEILVAKNAYRVKYPLKT